MKPSDEVFDAGAASPGGAGSSPERTSPRLESESISRLDLHKPRSKRRLGRIRRTVGPLLPFDGFGLDVALWIWIPAVLAVQAARSGWSTESMHPALAAATLAIAILASLPTPRSRIEAHLLTPLRRLLFDGNRGFQSWLLLGMCFLPAFVVFRATRRLGDATHLVSRIESGYRFDAQSPLGIFLQAGIYSTAGRWGWSADQSWSATSMIAGVAYVATTCWLVSVLCRRSTDRVLALGLMLTLGTMQLYFGYVETYPLSHLAVLLLIGLSVSALSGPIRMLAPALAFGLAIVLSMSTAPLGLGLVALLIVQCLRSTSTRLRSRLAFETIGGALLPWTLLLVFFWVAYGATPRVVLASSHMMHPADKFVPLSGPQGLFSRWHLRELANLAILVAPVLPVLLIGLLLRMRRGGRADAVALIVLAYAFGAAAFFFVWFPQLGFPHDWDLFALPALPAAAAVCVLLDRHAIAEEVSRWLPAACVVAGIQTFAWILRNADRP